MKKTKSYAIPLEDILLRQWKNPKNARIAVEVAVEEFEKDNDLPALLNILRLVAQAQGGLAKLARKAATLKAMAMR